MTEKLDSYGFDPSSAAGNTADSQEVMHAQMAEVVPMLTTDESAYKEWVPGYVARRAAELSAQTTIRDFGVVTKSSKDFLSPEVSVNMGSYSRSYFLDDDSAYEAAFGFLRDKYEELKAKLPAESAYANTAIYATGHGQELYFQSLIGNAGARAGLAADILSDDDEPEDNSIADYKDIAMCLERAAVAHNTLKILGMDSQIIAGRVAVRNEDGSVEEEPHAFLTVASSDGESRFIFDPTNPILFRNNEGKIVGHKPAIYKIEDSEAKQLSGGLREYFQQPDGTFALFRTREVVYAFPES